MFFNDVISELQNAKTLIKINNILDIAKDKINGLSKEEITQIELEVTKQKQKLYFKSYCFK